jgi:predicted enzyme related to lactoylglutathione lyase
MFAGLFFQKVFEWALARADEKANCYSAFN